ncbi:MAG: tRNA pseudouridine(38-40) synthase TruA [Ignavibacteria bacterium]|nr:tRNA pseudouridine(38-40) synthase TruA [Ignavibacteria bacterium]
MPNFRLGIEYDGTDFYGWQIQPEGRTVQGEITAALGRLFPGKINLIGAGRTDTGVHAAGQVASFKTSEPADPQELVSSLNGLLPPDIRIHSVQPMPDSFHPRFDARERVYRYYCSRRPTAIARRTRWHVTYPLDQGRLQEGAGIVQGVHDFTAFSKGGTDLRTYLCDVRKSVWSFSDDLLVYEISADRFVRGMVRALVGTMIDLGRGHLSTEDFARVLASKDRSRAGTLAPPHGLVLEEVRY